ncbi:tRNA pseudouridine(38-40) synthase TruA [Wenzhouxiangella sp. XN79A]|uniref:tRNA pseudouridine(38-40) synthase TruA n=1 Tax=Wenzhouxiangella sp. XN79A TaxID=2724193 RepID=UPI00197CE6CF|nr:tRNA pseudouridine(38-40) synthase TruA [Wenzhouxiangella sp. XN79A]
MISEPEPGDRQRIAFGLEYDGSRFRGFQRQRQRPTVQEVLEDALSIVADETVTVHCAGRTDTGVHAACQVIHIETSARRSERAWVLGVNSNLPGAVAVRWARFVDERFHARFSARGRYYRYRILNRWIRPGLEAGRVAWERRPLDAERMHEAAQRLVGEHDFSSFRALGCQARHARRHLHSIEVRRHGDEVVLDVAANAFLYHMVRNIAGTLIAVGCGEREPAWVGDVLAARDRTRAGVTAPPEGLCFMGVDYPEHPELPSRSADLAAFPRGRDLS